MRRGLDKKCSSSSINLISLRCLNFLFSLLRFIASSLIWCFRNSQVGIGLVCSSLKAFAIKLVTVLQNSLSSSKLLLNFQYPRMFFCCWLVPLRCMVINLWSVRGAYVWLISVIYSTHEGDVNQASILDCWDLLALLHVYSFTYGFKYRHASITESWSDINAVLLNLEVRVSLGGILSTLSSGASCSCKAVTLQCQPIRRPRGLERCVSKEEEGLLLWS